MSLRLEHLKTERHALFEDVEEEMFLVEMAHQAGRSKEETHYAQTVRKKLEALMGLEREIELHFNFLESLWARQEKNTGR